MIPYKTIIKIDKSNKQAIYLQLANQFVLLIKEGVLIPNTKIPSSRLLAEQLGLHRKTIVACYNELLIQGWIESIPKKGTYVHSKLPVLQSKNLGEFPEKISTQTGFKFYKKDKGKQPDTTQKEGYTYLNDGIGDVRLTPIKEIAQMYRSICNSKRVHKELNYGTTYGNLTLRKVLTQYLNETRGLKLTVDNILITRGSQMGISLAGQLLLQGGDKIVVGETNYVSADYTFLNLSANLLRVKVDAFGIDTTAVEKLCKKHQIKAIYVTSHHHHPTTKTMSAERRLHLLNLAKQYQFAIIEDDYDYDFHYNRAPILPLASHDTNGNVIYIGSVCKTVAPVFRIGYIIASKEFIDEAAKLRRYIDRQGDALLELTFAEFIKSGSLDRHINKTLKVYQKRRDLFINQLKDLKRYFDFEIPDGGMAFWLKLKAPFNWDDIAIKARNHHLEIGEWKRYDLHNSGHNAIRLGFASFNEEEIIILFDKLKNTLEEVNKSISIDI